MSEQVLPADPSDSDASNLGLNAWLVEEMYQEYLINPALVSADWREAFTAMPRANGSAPAQTPPAPAEASGAQPSPVASAPIPEVSPTPIPPAQSLPVAKAQSAPAWDDPALPLRGAAARVVANMTASLSVPTATSVHPVPAKLLDVNRRLINDQLARNNAGKVSFTHLIAWAVVRALKAVPVLNSSFVADIDGTGTPGVVHHSHVGLGIAIDLERSDGSRNLVVPVITNADSLDFAAFVAAYEAIVTKARTNKLSPEDFSGVTVTITNPGTLGTTQSVPRLMAGQGAIIGIGALDYPVEYQATDPETLSQLGVGKVVTLTSTYDHRIIQGAESGLFLKRVHELLVGEEEFYDEVFTSLGVGESPARWQVDRRPLQESEVDLANFDKQLAVRQLIEAYRQRGHRAAHIDPLSANPPEPPPELDPASYGLSVWDLDRNFACAGLGGESVLSLASILDLLRSAYCGVVGIEYMHIDEPEEQRFIQERVEVAEEPLAKEEQRYILERLSAAELFEQFLHTRYIGQRRFSLEGGETTITFLDTVLEESARTGTLEAVIGMAHRGRLNALANILGKPYEEIFSDFEGNLDPTTVQGSGDVKYHKGGAGKWFGQDGLSLPVTMPPNPSHLEAVNPVVEGIARARQDRLASGESFPVLAVLVHGDASFAGQGVVFETLNLSALEGYRVGGSMHLVINNQLGFTTPPSSARSTWYCTEVAKSVGAPIFHVNGDDPEAVVRVARLAESYRERFHKDVVVDLVCYRLHGHNEGDDPSYTQPLIYRAIESHPSVRSLYAQTLERRGTVSAEEATQIENEVSTKLQLALEATRADPREHLEHLPERPRLEIPRLSMPTGVSKAVLDQIEHRLDVVPPGFVLHPKLERQFHQRAELYAHHEVDWATGEALALGSLVLEGTDVRLTGQDSRRGTFSHRHAVLVDYETGAEFTPLASLTEQIGELAPLASTANPGRFAVRDSLLSEYAAMGFEYGYSVENKDALVLWEAQFGDFANGAQIMIDNFIAAAEEKWGQSSGLVLLLPHGYEGQGPEHSSARIERFLSLGAAGNLSIVQPSTAVQYFHLLRAQARRSLRRPLIVFTPKSLLRARAARSSIEEFVSGSFSEVLDDPGRGSTADTALVNRLVCCSGKIAFSALERRDELARSQSWLSPSAVIRIEQLFPWPEAQLVDVLDRYPNAEELIWLQDEPENMGAWSYARDHLQALFGERYRIRRVSRAAAGSPATGSHELHDLEAAFLIDEAVGPSSKN